jgi:hypothetical protein
MEYFKHPDQFLSWYVMAIVSLIPNYTGCRFLDVLMVRGVFRMPFLAVPRVMIVSLIRCASFYVFLLVFSFR